MLPSHSLLTIARVAQRLVDHRMPGTSVVIRKVACGRKSRTIRARPVGFRQYSSPISNGFWKDLSLAVGEGDGEKAEHIVISLSKEYSQEDSLDTRIFSLVLEAWRKSDLDIAAERSTQLLNQMLALWDEGILTKPPSLGDYHSVLECWANSNGASLQAATTVLEMLERISKYHHPTEQTFELGLQVLANGGYAESALRYMQSNIPRPFHSVELCNLVLQAHVQWNHPDSPSQAQNLLEQMLQDDNSMPEPDGKSFDHVLQCWAMNPSHPKASQNAQNLLSEMKRRKIRRTLLSYQCVISILADQGEAQIAEQYLTSLVKDYGAQFDAQLKPTVAPFETVLLAFSKSYHSDAAPRAESLLSQMQELHQGGIVEGKPDAWSYNFVLKCWMHSRRKDAHLRAKQLLDSMRSEGVPPDTSSINSYMNVLANQVPAIEVEQYLNSVYQSYLEDPIHNPQPDLISFGTVLKAWASSHDPQAAERAEVLLLRLQKLHESGWPRCKPDQAIFSNVMKCLAYSGNKEAPHKAEAILRSLQQEAKEDPMLKPDTVCWNMAIQAWARAGEGPRAEMLFNDMLEDYLADKETGAAPNNVTCSVVLSAWAKTQRNPRAGERAEALLQQMKQLAENEDLDIKPNVITYSIVLDCLAYAKSSSAALRAESILREMKASEDPNVRPNAVSYNSVIKAWSFSRDPSALFKVTALFKEMIHGLEHQKNKKLTPNENTFGSILKVLADSQVPDKAKRAQIIVDLMEKFGIKWNSWSRNQWRRCLHGDNEKGSRGRRRGKSAKQFIKDEIPDIPDLKYS